MAVLNAQMSDVPPGAVIPTVTKRADGSLAVNLRPRVVKAAALWLSVSDGGGYITAIIAEFGVLELVAPVTQLDENLTFDYLDLLATLMHAVAQGQLVQVAEQVTGGVLTETIVNLGDSLLRLSDHDRGREVQRASVEHFAPWT